VAKLLLRDVACSSKSDQRATSQWQDINKLQTTIGAIRAERKIVKIYIYIRKENKKDREHDVPAGPFYL